MYLSLDVPHTLRDWVEIVMMATSPDFDSGDHFKFNPILYTGFYQSCYYTKNTHFAIFTITHHLHCSAETRMPISGTGHIHVQTEIFQQILLLDLPWSQWTFSVCTSILLKFLPRLYVHSIWNSNQKRKDHKGPAQAYVKQHLILSNQDKVWPRAAKGRGEDRQEKVKKTSSRREKLLCTAGPQFAGLFLRGTRVSSGKLHELLTMMLNIFCTSSIGTS